MEEFLSGYDSHQTRRNYRADLRQFFGEEGATRAETTTVETEDILEFLGGKASDLARSTLKRKVESLQSFFRWLTRRGLIEKGPLHGVKTKDVVDQVLQGENGPEGDASSRQEAGEQMSGRKEGEESGTAPSKIPDWITEKAKAHVDTDRLHGKRFRIGVLPAALNEALGWLAEVHANPHRYGYWLSYGSRLSIFVEYYHRPDFGRDSRDVVVVEIEHEIPYQIGHNYSERSMAAESIPAWSPAELLRRDWAFPPEMPQEQVGILSGFESVQYPVWAYKPADSPDVQRRAAAEITATLVEGFGLGRNEVIMFLKERF